MCRSRYRFRIAKDRVARQLVAYARLQPGKLNWGATTGALDYVVPGFLKRAGLELTHISYKDIAPALQDLSEARIHLYVSALASQLGMVRSGNIKVVAITNRERSVLIPETPTTSEVGFNDLGGVDKIIDA